ncbi:uncharacterized protein B0H18DRAFT_957068 [Fomitopsis serialis]|uniref:uncharacterized protein n=1 Tax=Fomitopsis serialis TaxID=139415 RepID=UPI002008B42B|nr:uncharacterized protein B0H18DRAFT_957068 [Neoantrodia serialis]KAH9920485.1 hypothetical protein B0H18DRAFT_957068 [Neoantrodia serialis]
MYDCSVCPATRSVEQGNKRARMQALVAVDSLDPPATLSGWVLLGSILESHVGVFIPRCLQGPSVKVVVETLVFALDAYPPLSLPLIWEIHGDEIEISLSQPVMIQLFRGLNVWKSHQGPLGMTFDFFHVPANKFIPACLRPQVPFRLAFPLQYTPVFKDSAVSITVHADKYAGGQRPMPPMCSMKAEFLDFDFVCPVDLPQPRKCLKAKWRIEHRGSPQGTVAVRPLMGEDGCTVENLVTLDPDPDLDSDLNSDRSEAVNGVVATAVAYGVEELDAVEIWEILPGGKEIPYVEGERAAEEFQRSEVEVWEIRPNGFLVPCIYLFQLLGFAQIRFYLCCSPLPLPFFTMAGIYIDRRVLPIIATHRAPTISSVEYFGATQLCPFKTGLAHITVMCLDRAHIGELYDYPTDEERRLILEDVDATRQTDDPIRLGGWVFLGAVAQFYADQNASSPISIPLLCEIGPFGLQIEIPGPAHQPLMQQVFPGLNPWKDSEERRSSLGVTGFDLYDVDQETFYPTILRGNVPIRFNLPLQQMPIFKLSHVGTTPKVYSYAHGIYPDIKPLCSMKRQFMDLEYVWPQLPLPRAYMEAQWSVVNAGPLGIVAQRPALDEPGCTVVVPQNWPVADDHADENSGSNDAGEEAMETDDPMGYFDWNDEGFKFIGQEDF